MERYNAWQLHLNPNNLMSVAMPLKPVHEMTPYERERDLTPIVRDILRAYSLKNYSLIWRYLNHDYAQTLDAECFAQQCDTLHNKFSHSDDRQSNLVLEVDSEASWKPHPPQADGVWIVTMKNSNSDIHLELYMTLGNRKEFLEIIQLELR